jgi:hypothetical protein
LKWLKGLRGVKVALRSERGLLVLRLFPGNGGGFLYQFELFARNLPLKNKDVGMEELSLKQLKMPAGWMTFLYKMP